MSDSLRGENVFIFLFFFLFCFVFLLPLFFLPASTEIDFPLVRMFFFLFIVVVVVNDPSITRFYLVLPVFVFIDFTFNGAFLLLMTS